MKCLLTLLLISNLALSKDMCSFMFRKNIEKVYSVDFDKIQRLNRLEEWSGKFRARAYKEDPLTPTVARKSRKAFEQVEEKLLVGESVEAVSAYRALYRQVEGSALVIERYSDLSSAMRKAKENGIRNYHEFFKQEGVVESLAKEFSQKINSADDLLEQLKKVEKTLRKRYRKLGRDFEKYNYARMHIDALAKAEHCSPVCKEAIKEFRKGVGIASKGEVGLFKHLLGSKKAYSLNKVRDIFNSHPESVLVARKTEFFREGFALLKKYANDIRLFSRLYTAMAMTELAQTSRLIRFFRSIYDKRYLDTDLIIFKRIAHSEAEVAKKFEIMEKQTSGMNRDQFWMNFSRSTEGQIQKTWDELIDYAKKTGSKFYERMAKAAEVGKKLGPVGRERIKGLKRLVVAVVAGGVAWSYVNFDSPDVDNVDVDNVDGGADELPVIPGIDGDDIQMDEGQDDETEVLIDYMSEMDTELTDSLGVLYQFDRETGN